MSAPRFLLVSLSNIGDAIMTTPVLQALHAFEPAAIVDVVGDRRSSEIFSGCPFLGRIIHKEKQRALRGLVSLLGELRSVRYDLAVDLRTDFLPILIRARRRFFRWQGHASGPHAVQQHLGVIARLPLKLEEFCPILWLSPARNEFASNMLGGFAGRRLLALGPGANWPPKIWPAQNFIELLESVRGEFDAAVLLGGAADQSHAGAIAAAAPLPCLDLTGKTGLLEAAAVLAQAQIFVGNDSGLGHIAAAVQTPTVTLFGVGDPARYHPWGPGAAWLVGPERDLNRLRVLDVNQLLRAHLSARRSEIATMLKV
jgi:ADP-heptose:LPS heptosyltransferase